MVSSKASKRETAGKGKEAKSSSRRCPECGAEMVNDVCPKCKYSPGTAYKNRREAKEFTFAG